MAKSDTATTSSVIAIEDLENGACTQVLEFTEQGFELPIGLWVNGERQQSFELSKIAGTLYRRLQKLFENSQLSWAEAALKALPQIVTSIGGMPLREVARSFDPDQTDPDLTRVFRKMYFADIAYLIYRARVMSVGGKIELQWTCEANREHKNKDNAKAGDCHDLSYSEVTAYHPRFKSEPLFSVAMPQGCLELDGTPINVVHIRPLRLEDVIKFSKQKDRNNESFTVSAMQSCVVALPEHSLYSNMRGVVLGAEVIDRVQDCAFMNRLEDAIGTLQKLGPDTVFEVDCRFCGHRQEIVVPYTELGSFLMRSARAA